MGSHRARPAANLCRDLGSGRVFSRFWNPCAEELLRGGGYGHERTLLALEVVLMWMALRNGGVWECKPRSPSVRRWRRSCCRKGGRDVIHARRVDRRRRLARADPAGAEALVRSKPRRALDTLEEGRHASTALRAGHARTHHARRSPSSRATRPQRRRAGCGGPAGWSLRSASRPRSSAACSSCRRARAR